MWAPRKTEELCLETILEEVWADAGGQFDDGWQQLYMLACLKKYFGDLWNVPEASVVSDSEIDSDYEDELKLDDLKRRHFKASWSEVAYCKDTIDRREVPTPPRRNALVTLASGRGSREFVLAGL